MNYVVVFQIHTGPFASLSEKVCVVAANSPEQALNKVKEHLYDLRDATNIIIYRVTDTSL